MRVIEDDDAADEQSDILSTFSEAAGDPRVLTRERLKKQIEHSYRAASASISTANRTPAHGRPHAQGFARR